MRLARFILLALVVSILTISCGNSASSSTSSPQTTGSLLVFPLKKEMGNVENGWTNLHVKTAVVNLYSDWRLFRLEDRYPVKVSSSESRAESVKWNGHINSPSAFFLPPGFVVYTQNGMGYADISVKIPENMTNIQLNIPYIDMPMRTEEYKSYYPDELTPNENAYVDLDSDLRDASSINFPIMDSSLATISQLRETVNLETSKLSLTVTDFQRDGKNLSVTTQIKNTNSLETGKWRITLFGAGSDGFIYRGSSSQNSPCRQFDAYHPIELNVGPSQETTCTFSYQGFPNNVSNLYIWIAITNSPEEYEPSGIVQDYVVFFLGQ